MSAADVLRDEIRSQPSVWRGVAASSADALGPLGALLAASPPSLVRIAAHGTSDHAAAYAAYAWRLLCGWTVLRDSMALPLYYGAPAAAPGELAIGISQSGETPDVVAWLRRARECGARTVAVTNGAGSSLAAAADHVVLVGAGEERSIAATKTYTATVASLALVAAFAAGRGPELTAALQTTADLAEDALPALAAAVDPVAEAFAEVERMYVVARGVELATADEIALKLTEVCYLGAKAMSATAMAHGPVAALDSRLPVWAVAASDAALPAVQEAAQRARDAGAPLVASGAAASALGDATFRLPTPAAPDPLLAPLLSVLPGQLFAVALALAKHLDPGTPRHLRKVTSAA